MGARQGALAGTVVAAVCIWATSAIAEEAKLAMVLEGLEFEKRLVTHLGCLEACAKQLKVAVSPGWLYGGTGHAFVMCLGEDLCPSGPHCWRQGSLHRLARNLPVRIKGVAGPKATPELLEKAWKHVRSEIDAGYPCYGWHWEWVLVRGYDADGYVYSGCIEPPKDWRAFGAKAIGFLELYSVRPQKPASDVKTIRDALAFAVEHAAKPDVLGGYTGGVRAYDTWIKGLSENTPRYLGLAYHAGIWAECRRFAVAFLEEANTRTGKRHDALFQPAVAHYRAVADALEAVSRLAPLPPGWPPDKKQWGELSKKPIDAAVREKAIAQLKKAAEAEKAGLEAIKKLVAALDAS